MKTLFRFCLFGLLIVPGFFKSCVNNTIHYNEYETWLNNPVNKLVLEQESKGYDIKVNYLPAEFLAATYANKNRSKASLSYDSLLLKCQKSAVFMITVKGNHAEKPITKCASVPMTLLNNDKDVKIPCRNYARIVLESGEVLPIQTRIELNKDSSNELKMYCIFNKSSINKEQRLDLVFTTGPDASDESHFVFNQKDIRNRPVLL